MAGDGDVDEADFNIFLSTQPPPPNGGGVTGGDQGGAGTFSQLV